MSSLGPVSFSEKDELVFFGREFSESRNYSEKVATKIDDEVEKFIKTGEKEALAILNKKRKLLDKIAETLVREETIEKDEFEKIIRNDLDFASPKKVKIEPNASPIIEPKKSSKPRFASSKIKQKM